MAFVLPILIYPLAFLLLFIIAELLYYRARVDGEYTRKIVHAGTGLLTLGFPHYFTSFWQVIIICTLFLVILIASRKLNLLRSINDIKRKTVGSILYPLIVIVVFVFYQFMNTGDSHNLIYFYLPILIMAISDPVAAITGNHFKKTYPRKPGKTLAGTLAFAATAFLISMALYFAFFPLTIGALIAWSALTAITTALIERVSNGGWDNFTIPLAAMCVLYLLNHFQ